MYGKWWKTLSLDIQKQWFRIGEVAFVKVSRLFKKLGNLLQKWIHNFTKILWKVARRVPKMRSYLMQELLSKLDEKRSPKYGQQTFFFFDVFLYFFEVWLQRCPRVVPGTLPGSLQGQNSFKMALKKTRKSSNMFPAGFLKTLLKNTRTKQVFK